VVLTIFKRVWNYGFVLLGETKWLEFPLEVAAHCELVTGLLVTAAGSGGLDGIDDIDWCSSGQGKVFWDLTRYEAIERRQSQACAREGQPGGREEEFR